MNAKTLIERVMSGESPAKVLSEADVKFKKGDKIKAAKDIVGNVDSNGNSRFKTIKKGTKGVVNGFSHGYSVDFETDQSIGGISGGDIEAS